MEHSSSQEPPACRPESMVVPATAPQLTGTPGPDEIQPQQLTGAHSYVGSAPSTAPAIVSETPPYVYALGRIEPRFPNLGLEREFRQAMGRTNTAGLTDRQALREVLSERHNRYLLRQLCWVLTIQGLETYILRPRDPGDFDLLAEALRPEPQATDVDVLVGTLGPLTSPDVCNGLMIPIVAFDQVYSFGRDQLVEALVSQATVPQVQIGTYQAAVGEVFDRLIQLVDNVGTTDGHRALNFLATRYPQIYARATEQYVANYSLTAVELRVSPVSDTRRVLDVILSFTNRRTDFTEKYYVSVDVTEEFPFVARNLGPYFDR